jgi:hypothetical protein
MTTRAEREIKRMNHDQDLTEVQEAAAAERERDRQRTEHEREVERTHEALAEESRRVHFLERGLCP